MQLVLFAIGAGFLVLGVLIFVHELGHCLAAKSAGIAVLRFSFGLGPRTRFGIHVGETDYCLSWIPFGGYVTMAGLDDKPLWTRVGVMSAGPIMNAVFAVLVYSVIAFSYGGAESPFAAIGIGAQEAADAASLVLVSLNDLVLGQTSFHDLGGPILIVQLSGQVARQGLEQLLGLIGFLSMNLAVLNLLPIPLLDGGQLVLIAVEGARRRPLSLRQRQAATQSGLLALAGIVAVAVYHDLMRTVG